MRAMRKKNHNIDWDAGLAAPMSARVPEALGGMRLDQALARLFPQYSRNRLQAWLKSGHLTLDGKRFEANHAVTGSRRASPTLPRRRRSACRSRWSSRTRR